MPTPKAIGKSQRRIDRDGHRNETTDSSPNIKEKTPKPSLIILLNKGYNIKDIGSPMIDTATRPPSSQFVGRKRGVFPRLACRGWVANTSTIMKKRGGFPRLACPGGVAKTSTNEKTKKNHPLYDKNDDTIAAIPSRQCFSGKIVKQIFSVKSTVISCLIRQKETFWDTFKSQTGLLFF